ncbi:MAG: hypothetical protein PVG71_08055 [Anaerolineae bacterium]
MSLLVILHIAIFGLLIVTSDDSLQVQYTPDDGYYYLQLAKNFSKLGLWTFDSGHSLTSGFHPLWAYLLSLIHRVGEPSSSLFVQYGVICSSLVTVLSLLIAWTHGLHFKKPFFLLLLALMASSSNFAINSVSVVEWPVVILLSMTYCMLYRRFFVSDSSVVGVVALFASGFAGSLARSDFGLLPLSIFVANLLLSVIGRDNRAILASSGLMGAVAGVLSTLVHNYLFSGSLLQSSARMKNHWAQFYGPNYLGVVGIFIDTVGLGGLAMLLAATSLLGLVSLGQDGFSLFFRKLRDSLGGHCRNSCDCSSFLGGALCVAGYGLFYLGTPAIQPWYSASLAVPIFLLLVSLSSCVERLFGSSALRVVSSVMGVVFIANNVIGVYPLGANSPWPHQSVMLRAGKYLGRQEIGGLVGSWNAGIIGYYSGGDVINLDGLVNNEVYEYAANNDLPSYVESQGIKYVVDFETVLEDETRRQRGGFDDQAFVRNLKPRVVFDESHYYWNHLTLYEFTQE